MPNKYYLREDRKAVTKDQYDSIKNLRPNPEVYNIMEELNKDLSIWEKILLSLPALDVDPDYLKRLSPGWFEGEERREILTKGGWAEIGGDWYNRAKESHRRLTIVAPQEAEKGQEGEVTMQRPWEAAIDYCNQNHVQTPKDVFKRCFNSFIAGVNWKHNNEFATPQPVAGEDIQEMAKEAAKEYFIDLYGESWEMEYNSQQTERKLLEKMFLAGAASRPSDAVEFAEWTGKNGWRYSTIGAWVNEGEERTVTAQQLYKLFKPTP